MSQPRTFDWAVYHGVKPGIKVQLRNALIQEGKGWKVTGLQKAVQKFLLLLLTPQESVAYDPGRGCLFLPFLLSGRVQVPADVHAAFAASLIQILPQLRKWEDPLGPPDERIAEIDLQSVDVSFDTARLFIRIVSQAGERVSVILPLRDLYESSRIPEQREAS